MIIDDWVERAGRGGRRFGLGDLLIGALASEIGALVWSLDADFARMETLNNCGVLSTSWPAAPSRGSSRRTAWTR